MSELHDTILVELRRHGVEPVPGDTPASLRERLSARYVDAIRELKGRLKEGAFPMDDYPTRVQRLKEDYPLLGVPVSRWGP